jgi:SAM-dependent methyltransferase
MVATTPPGDVLTVTRASGLAAPDLADVTTSVYFCIGSLAFFLFVTDYNAINAGLASSLCRLRNRRVLVVGCNAGSDCEHFVKAGAEVHGLDVIPDIGSAYNGASYIRANAQLMPLPSNYYDLVYCYATMEHVQDIRAAFNEMARVTAKGGYIYCVASPLWHSRVGHHKPGLIPDWGHLIHSRDELYGMCTKHDVDYALDRRYFNRESAKSYINACSNLQDMAVIKNELDFDSVEIPACLHHHNREELLAVTHIYIARKGGLGFSRTAKNWIKRTLLR